MENQTEEKMENEMETGVISGYIGLMGVLGIMENQMDKKMEQDMGAGIMYSYRRGL